METKMIRRLARRLALINASIVLVLFLLLAGSWYWMLPPASSMDFDLARARAICWPPGLVPAMAIFAIAGALAAFGAAFFLASRLLSPLAAAWQQQTDFLADAVHALRAPLAVIRTNLDLVLASPAETVASQGKWLGYIREETAAMARLVSSLLFLARADSKPQALAKRPFSFYAALIEAVAPFEAAAAAGGLSLNVAAAAGEDYTVCGDEARLKEVIGILLDNAIRHTPAGGGISLFLSRDGRQILLTVADTGEGIAPEHLATLFDRFFQPGRAGKPQASGGAGLGLAIARRIIESHGGSIVVASTPGTGTVFMLRLPAQHCGCGGNGNAKN